jgi:hypothetical protein
MREAEQEKGSKPADVEGTWKWRIHTVTKPGVLSLDSGLPSASCD